MSTTMKSHPTRVALFFAQIPTIQQRKKWVLQGYDTTIHVSPYCHTPLS